MLKTTIEKVINEDLSAIWTVLDNEERRRIVDNFEMHNFKKNQIIYTQGEEAEHLWCLLKGKVKMYKDGIPLSDKLHTLYAKELLIAGEKADFVNAIPYFEEAAENPSAEPENRMESYCVLAKAYRLKGDITRFFKYTTKALTSEVDGCSEICRELGLFYDAAGDFLLQKIQKFFLFPLSRNH